MKNILSFLGFALFMIAATTAASGQSNPTKTAQLQGAWQMQGMPDEHVVIVTEDYFAYTRYNKTARKFEATFGGTYKTENGRLTTHLEFHSADSQRVGTSVHYPFTLTNDALTITVDGKNTTWKRLDGGNAPLAGNWRITGRMQDGKLQPMQHRGGRKTVKILSGTRFQWAAINTDTKEFSGTGGGTYTFRNGKYTETIEFFSRDSSRVGASLSFDGKVEPDGWHHSGLSSRGDAIYEVWNKTK